MFATVVINSPAVGCLIFPHRSLISLVTNRLMSVRFFSSTQAELSAQLTSDGTSTLEQTRRCSTRRCTRSTVPFACSTRDGRAAADYLRETSLLHMTRCVAGARSQVNRDWIAGHVRSQRLYRLSKGNIRPRLRRKRKAIAGRYCRFLSGHAAIRSNLCDRMHKTTAASASGTATASDSSSFT